MKQTALSLLALGAATLGAHAQNFGIGTTTPNSRLSVVSNGAGVGTQDDLEVTSYNTAASPSILMRSAQGSETTPSNLAAGSEIGSVFFTGRVGAAWSNQSGIRGYYSGDGTTSASDLRFYTSGANERMRIASDGRVGIGTTSPAFPLDVQATHTPSNFAYAYLTLNAGALSTGSTTSTAPVSIRAAGRIVCTEFNATSDARLKSITGRADAAADLATLRAIRITDYTMKDRVQHGDKIFRKVIAQEVENVYPMAVNKSTGFVPTIYAKAVTATSASTGRTIVTLPAAHGLKVGQKVRLIGEANGTLEAAVVAVSGEASFSVSLPLEEKNLFVYGPEVDDLRTVDYEAIAMLNVSATQELANKVEELQSQVVSLAAENDALRKEAVAYAELAERVKELQQMLGVTPKASGAKVGKN